MTLHGMDADKYPELPKVQGDSIELSADLIRYAAEYVATAASGDSDIFGTVLLDKGAIVATDSHRLHFLTTSVDIGRQALVPRPAFLALAKLLDGDIAKLTFGQGHLHYAGDNVTYSARLMAGQYPQWRQIVDSLSAKTTVAVDKQELVGAVNLAACITRDEAKERQGIVRLEATEWGLTVSARSAEAGDARTNLTATVEGDETQVQINGGYLLDMVKPISGAVALEFAGSTKPVVVRHGDFTALCLPIRER